MLLLRISIFTILIGLIPIGIRSGIAYFDFETHWRYIFQDTDILMLCITLCGSNLEAIIGLESNSQTEWKLRYGAFSLALLMTSFMFIAPSYMKDFNADIEKSRFLWLSLVDLVLTIAVSVVIFSKIQNQKK